MSFLGVMAALLVVSLVGVNLALDGVIRLYYPAVSFKGSADLPSLAGKNALVTGTNQHRCRHC